MYRPISAPAIKRVTHVMSSSSTNRVQLLYILEPLNDYNNIYIYIYLGLNLRSATG